MERMSLGILYFRMELSIAEDFSCRNMQTQASLSIVGSVYI